MNMKQPILLVTCCVTKSFPLVTTASSSTLISWKSCLFVLGHECYHTAFECRLANPFSGDDRFLVDIEPCKDACDVCTSKHKQKVPRVVHAGLWRALVSLFFGEDPIDNLTMDDVLVERRRAYLNALKEFFGSKAKGTPEPRDTKMPIVMLLCAEIFTYQIGYAADDSEKRNPIVLARLKPHANGTLYLNDDSHLSLIPSRAAISE